MGLGDDARIRDFFGEDERIEATLAKDPTTSEEEGLLETYRKLRPGEPPTVESAQSHLNSLFFDARRYDLSRFGRYKMNQKLALAKRIAGHVAARDIIAPLTGELLVAAGEKGDQGGSRSRRGRGREPCAPDGGRQGSEGVHQRHGGREGVFLVRPGRVRHQRARQLCRAARHSDETENVEEQKELLRRNHDKLISKTVTVDDIFASVNYLNNLGHGLGATDDIDHLGNRRIRSVGELLQNQFRIGFSRMERVIRERMTLQAQDMEVVTPQALINIRPVVAAVKEFFGSSPLSQFMDQNNPLQS